MSEQPRVIRRKIFNLVGEAGTTRTGTQRQKVLLGCEPGDAVQLCREPTNQVDANAILVLWRDEDIGYLPREAASLIAPHIDAGRPHRAQIHRINGGLPDYPNYGVEISIAWDGKAPPVFHPLDGRQERSRAAKLAAAKRQRDTTGAFVGSKSKGCAVMIGLIVIPVCAALGHLLVL